MAPNVRERGSAHVVARFLHLLENKVATISVCLRAGFPRSESDLFDQIVPGFGGIKARLFLRSTGIGGCNGYCGDQRGEVAT